MSRLAFCAAFGIVLVLTVAGQAEIQINTHSEHHQTHPAVAMNSSGRFVIAWIRMGDTYCRPYGEYIVIRQFEADGAPLGREMPLTDDLNSRWYGPSVATGCDGGFVVT